MPYNTDIPPNPQQNYIIMTELETKIWNTVHNWCDEQSSEIPDQNRRYLMDEIKALVLLHVSKSVKIALLQQLEELSDHLPCQVYTKKVIEIKSNFNDR